MKSWLVAALAAALGALGAEAQQPIVLTLNNPTGNPGDTVELEVSLVAGDARPATLIVFLEHAAGTLAPDNDFYPVTVTDFAGNTVVTRSAVLAGPAVEAAGKTLDLEVVSPGRLGVAVTGINDTTLPDGVLFTLALRIADATAAGTDLVVAGAGDSSASTASGQDDIPITFVDGVVAVGCSVPGAPGGLTASAGLAAGVEVRWTAVGSAAEYMVYRANSADVEQAIPVSVWLTGAVFLDETANPPQPVGPHGCCLPGQRTVFEHFYWVRARDAAGCQSTFAGPAAGYRGEAKAHAPAAGTPAVAAGALLMLGAVLWRSRPGRRRP